MKFLTFLLLFVSLKAFSFSENGIEQQTEEIMKLRKTRQSEIFKWGLSGVPKLNSEKNLDKLLKSIKVKKNKSSKKTKNKKKNSKTF